MHNRECHVMHSPIVSSKYATPTRHGEIRLWPAPAQMLRDLQSNRGLLNGPELEITGVSLRQLRAATRAELIDKAKQYHLQIGLELPNYDPEGPLIVTGHQCQFFHCGILIKYMLISYLARVTRGTALNISADSDLPKNTSLILPCQDCKKLSVCQINLPNIKPDLPLERQSLPGKNEFEKFVHRMRQVNSPDRITPVVDRLADLLKDVHSRARSPADMFNLLNHHLAGQLEVSWLELPLSVLGQSRAFLLFTAGLMLHARGVSKSYNEALAHYRRENKIRNDLQPMPDLKEADKPGEMQEVPLWISRQGQTRMPLFIRERKEKIFISNGQESLAQFSSEELKNPQRASSSMQAILKGNSLLIRPRALTLTIFARLFLADYFVHGIGGARYDQVADDFIRRFYQTAPPSFAVASATMHLPVGDYPPVEQAAEQLRQAQQRRRDLKYNPQRYIPDSMVSNDNPDSVVWGNFLNHRLHAISTSARLRQQRAGKAQRRRVFEEIHRLNARLVAAMAERADEIKRQIESAQQQYHQARIAHDREYFFGLFPPDVLKGVLLESFSKHL